MAIFCFLGQGQFFIEEKIKELKKRRLNLIYNKDFKDFFLNLQRFTNKNILDEENVIVIYNLEKLAALSKTAENELLTLVSFLKKNSEKHDFILVFKEEPIGFFDFLRKHKVKFELINTNFSGKNLENVISDYLTKHKLKLPRSIIDLLKENYANDIEFLFRDLEKIVILKDLHPNEMVQLLHLKVNIFKIQDYLLEKNWPHFIHHFKKFILSDKSYNKIETLKALSLFFHSLMKIYFLKTNQIAKIKGNKYYLSKLKEKAKGLTIEDVKKLILAIAKTERKLKKFNLDIKDIPEDISLNYSLT